MSFFFFFFFFFFFSFFLNTNCLFARLSYGEAQCKKYVFQYTVEVCDGHGDKLNQTLFLERVRNVEEIFKICQYVNPNFE